MNAITDQCLAFAAQNPNIEVLWLYGSQAKGTANDQSDYDFAVAFKNFPEDDWGKRLQPILLAQEWADHLGLPDSKISIIDINHVPIPLAFGVISSGKVLVNKNGLRLAREENRISSMWEDNYLKSAAFK